MSIIDKLPEAPEGYTWTTRIAVYSYSTEVWVKLDRDYGGKGFPPRVPESNSRLYVFCQPSEESLTGAAHLILERFEEGVSDAEYRARKTAEASKAYADLLTR